MKILIAADMEGISGVVHWDHVDPKHSDYEHFRRLMLGDVNAAVRGAFEAGADEVVVTDGHNTGRNLLADEIESRARLISGGPKPLAMVEGAQTGVDGVMFVGYHARSGAPSAILDHTWSSTHVANVWLNGRLVGETGLNAATCGHFNAPVIMISGDQTVCAEAVDLIGDLETAVVKKALGRMAAECLPASVAQQKIQAAAAQAVTRLRQGTTPPPLRLQTPITLAVEFPASEMADAAMIFPGARRGPDRRVECQAQDMALAYFAFRTLVALAR